MEWLCEEIAELELKIEQYEERLLKERDPARCESLDNIIRDDKVTLQGFVQQLAQIQSTAPAPQVGQNVAPQSYSSTSVPGPLPSTSYFLPPQIRTLEYFLEDIKGSLASLSGERGFRNYVHRRVTEIGVSGCIQRVAHHDANLVVQGTDDQITAVEAFLEEIRAQTMINYWSCQVQTSRVCGGFVVKKSRRKVDTGNFSDPVLDRLSGSSSRSERPLGKSHSVHSG